MTCQYGKFQGMIAKMTPNGWWTNRVRSAPVLTSSGRNRPGA